LEAITLPSPQFPDDKQPVLSLRGLAKSFGATKALDHADLDLYAGEIVGLVGDNGAGKSTLIKTLAGVYARDAGTIVYQGQECVFRDPLAARLAGIETVYQDLALCDNLSVWQNIFLGREISRRSFVPKPLRFLAKSRMRREATQILTERLGVGTLPLEARTRDLSGGQRQVVALARSEAWEARVFLLDEPTAALSADASHRVVEVMERLKRRGAAILVVSHNLPQVIEATHRIIVMRQGKTICTLSTREATDDLLLGLMTGIIVPSETKGSASRQETGSADG
jgi:ABC-type sugar transport system ATPase subunit